MKNRRYSEISSSEDSDEAPVREKPSTSKTAATSNNVESDESSTSSSSDSEANLRQNTSIVKQKKVLKNVEQDIGGSPLKQFTVANPDLVRLESKVVIDEDDDVCFLEVPKSLDVDQFIGKTINFDKKTKIKINKVKYVIEPSDESIKPITLLTKKLQVIQPVAVLHLHEYKKHKNHTIEVESVQFKPSLPENLKVRHPLFGAEYENKIILSEEIEKKLDNTIDDFVKKMKKKKKHKDKKSVEEQETIENEETIFTLLESHSTGKKKKKVKKEVVTDVEDHTEEVESHSTDKKKKKPKKEVTTDVEEDDDRSNKKINIINSTVIPGLPLSLFDFDVSGIAAAEKSTKKKKSSTNVDNSEEERQIDNEPKTKEKRQKERKTTESEYETEKEESSKKKKKTQDLLDSQISANKKKIKKEPMFDLQLPSFEHDSSNISAERNTKKKKSTNVENSEEEGQTDHEINTKRKKKRGKVSNESEYETEREESPKRKQKTQDLLNNQTNSKKIKEENMFDLQLPSFEFDTKKEVLSESEGLTNKKKKKDKSFDETEYETEKEESPRKRKLSEMKSDSEESSLKKKRKKEEAKSENLIMDLLTMVKNEIDEPKKNKKHKSDR